MKLPPLKWLSVTCAAAALAAGCAARTPAPRPAPATPIGQAGLIPNTAGSTTSDADACAVALGNAAGGPTEVTANGILIGNVALVALPTVDQLPITPPGGATAPGAAVTPPGPHPAPSGDLAQAQNVRAAPNPMAPLAPRGQRFDNGGAFDRTGTPGAVGRGGTAERTPPRTGGTVPAPGLAALPVPGGGAPAGADMDAVERIRRSCPAVAEIRVVTDSGDRARLAEIAMAMRKGQPVTSFMEEIGRISRGGAAAAGRTR